MPSTTLTLADLERCREAARDARSAYLFTYGNALFRRLHSLLRPWALKLANRPA